MVVVEHHMMLVGLVMVDMEMRPLLDQLVLLERHYPVLPSHNFDKIGLLETVECRNYDMACFFSSF